MIFLTKLCFYFDYKRLLNCKLKKIINEQTNILYIPPNALCLCDKTVQIE